MFITSFYICITADEFIHFRKDQTFAYVVIDIRVSAQTDFYIHIIFVFPTGICAVTNTP
jgi:hypothetical protein